MDEWDAAAGGQMRKCNRRAGHRWSAPDREFERRTGIQRQICGHCWAVRLTRPGSRPRYACGHRGWHPFGLACTCAAGHDGPHGVAGAA